MLHSKEKPNTAKSDDKIVTFLKINSEHIEYILFCMKRNTTKVRNIKAYLKSVIYNAPTTMNSFYSAEVNHDLYGTD